jgi:hypothetical protein
MADYVLGIDAFVELAPHTVTEGVLTVKSDVFPALDKKGVYTITYTFLSSGFPNKTHPENFWEGLITANPVTVVLR